MIYGHKVHQLKETSAEMHMLSGLPFSVLASSNLLPYLVFSEFHLVCSIFCKTPAHAAAP